MTNFITGIIIQDIAVIIFKNMDLFLRIVLGHTSKVVESNHMFQLFEDYHISRYFPTKSKAPSCEFDKGKGKEDVEHIKDEMNKTWKKKG